MHAFAAGASVPFDPRATPVVAQGVLLVGPVPARARRAARARSARSPVRAFQGPFHEQKPGLQVAQEAKDPQQEAESDSGPARSMPAAGNSRARPAPQDLLDNSMPWLCGSDALTSGQAWARWPLCCMPCCLARRQPRTRLAGLGTRCRSTCVPKPSSPLSQSASEAEFYRAHLRAAERATAERPDIDLVAAQFAEVHAVLRRLGDDIDDMAERYATPPQQVAAAASVACGRRCW